jgi:thymidylate synthase
MNIWENEYLNLVADILNYGVDCPDRTGIGCRKILNAHLSINLKGLSEDEIRFPASTVRLVGARVGFEEFWAFLNGVVMIDQHLRDRNVTYTDINGEVKTIWTGNTTREFLDKRGLKYLPVGHLGKSYGFQFRHWGGDYIKEEKRMDMTGVYRRKTDYTTPYGGIDQIKNVWNSLKNDPYSRRHIVTLLNSAQEKEMALVPCWHTHHFHVLGNELHLTVTGRSCDVLFGTPTNIQQYALYLIAMAKSLNMVPGTLHANLEDVHIYHNQIAYCEELVTREYNQSPTIKINKELSSLEDVLSLRWEDFSLENYNVNKTPFKTPRPDMAV